MPNTELSSRNTWREKLEWGWLFFYSVLQELENAIVMSLERFKGFLCLVVCIPPKLQNQQECKILCLHEVY